MSLALTVSKAQLRFQLASQIALTIQRHSLGLSGKDVLAALEMVEEQLIDVAQDEQKARSMTKAHKQNHVIAACLPDVLSSEIMVAIAKEVIEKSKGSVMNANIPVKGDSNDETKKYTGNCGDC